MRSIQTFLPPQAAEPADIRQGKGKAVQIFVTHISHIVAAVFRSDTAAVPVVGSLRGHELQYVAFRVKAEAGGAAEAAFRRLAIAYGCTKLIEVRRRSGTRGRCHGL